MDESSRFLRWALINHTLNDQKAREEFITKVSKPDYELTGFDTEILDRLFKANNTPRGGEVR